MISFDSVTKRYGKFTALNNVTFTARPGAVTGFLGPNGAGKSTAMRVLCGLTPQDSGSATIGGRPFAKLANPAAQVGVLLDASAQHAGRTGNEVLTLQAIALGVPRNEVGKVLELVGLTPKEAKRQLRNYSLGMRQRLGIACALLGSPQVLILDEPVNGLDPQGIRWMRDLLRTFADDGGTVLLSSHLLLEMEAVADDLVVIGNGKIVAQGPKEVLLGSSQTAVSSLNQEVLNAGLVAAGFEVHATTGELLTSATAEQVGQIALTNSVVLTGLAPAKNGGLEDLFFNLTQDHERDGGVSPVDSGLPYLTSTEHEAIN